MARGAGGREGLNRTHASFLNSLAGPGKRGENKRGEGNKRKYWCWERGGRGRAEGLLNAAFILNAAASAEKLHNLLQSPLRDEHASRHTRVCARSGNKGRGCAGAYTQESCEQKGHKHDAQKAENYAQTDNNQSSRCLLLCMSRAQSFSLTHTRARAHTRSVTVPGFCCALKGVLLFRPSQGDNNQQSPPRPRYCNHIGCIKSYTKAAPSRCSGPLRGFAPLRSACAPLTICSNQSGKFGHSWRTMVPPDERHSDASL